MPVEIVQRSDIKKNNGKEQAPLQKGTGLHVDLNCYNPWETELADGSTKELDRFRLFQSFVACSNASNDPKMRGRDGGLEIVPGFHRYCHNYFQKKDKVTGRNVKHWGNYLTKFSKKHDEWIYSHIQQAQRIPSDWKPEEETNLISPEKIKYKSEAIKAVSSIAKEHSKLNYVPIEEGDWVVWDIRMAHQNSDFNDTDQIRHVFYHAYILALDKVNGKRISHYKKIRMNAEHPFDFPFKYKRIESEDKDIIRNIPPLNKTNLGKLLYNYESYSPNFDLKDINNEIERKEIEQAQKLVSDRHIAFFKKYGYVVIENALPKSLVQNIRTSTQNFLSKHGIHLDLSKNYKVPPSIDPEKWMKISGNFGGMLEVFWLKEIEQVRISTTTYGITTQMMKHTWGSDDDLFNFPMAKVNPYHLWVYIDRQNLRFPTGWVTTP